jgi:hypothetical protein
LNTDDYIYCYTVELCLYDVHSTVVLAVLAMCDFSSRSYFTNDVPAVRLMIRTIFVFLCYFEETFSHLVVRAIAPTFRVSRRCDRIPEAILLLILWQCGAAIFQCDLPKLGDSRKEMFALIPSSSPGAQIVPLAVWIEFVQLCPSLL